MKTNTIWVAYTNTDLTQGAGKDVPIALCLLHATAERLARKRYVQGSDGPVRSIEALEFDGRWYLPQDALNVIYPTPEDSKAQNLMDAKRLAIARARVLGLTEDEIAALGFK